ncbi:MAG: hypothetical protein ACR2HS_00890, partial [Gammaproteobacteria bacterium]
MIKYNSDSLIYNYKLEDVIKGIKYEVKYGKPAFEFDYNFNMMQFFNYFLEEAEREEKYAEAEIITNYMNMILESLPTDLKGVVDFFVENDVITFDDETKAYFASTQSVVIASLLLPSSIGLIEDEFLFHFGKSILLDNLRRELQIKDIPDICFHILQEVSKRIKEQIGDAPYPNDETPLTEEEKEMMAESPKNFTEAVDSLVKMMEQSEHKNYLSDDDSVDVLSAFVMQRVSHILLSSVFLF